MGIYNSKEYLNKILSLILYTTRQERGNIMAKDYSVFDIVGPNMIGHQVLILQELQDLERALLK